MTLHHYHPSPTGGHVCRPEDASRVPYLLAFNNDNTLSPPPNQTTVRVIDDSMMANLVAMLGESCVIGVSDAFAEKEPQLAKRVEELGVAPCKLELPVDIDALRETLHILPLALPSLVGKGLALYDDDPLPSAIDRSLVHKKRVPMF